MLGEEVQLLPDKTIFIQLAIFLVVAVALNHFVFRPILKILALRRAKTKEEGEKLQGLSERTETLVKDYETKIKEAKQEGFKIKESIRREGETQAQKVVLEARKASLSQMETIKETIEKETEAASKKLEKGAEDLAKTLAEKILGR